MNVTKTVAFTYLSVRRRVAYFRLHGHEKVVILEVLAECGIELGNARFERGAPLVDQRAVVAARLLAGHKRLFGNKEMIME